MLPTYYLFLIMFLYLTMVISYLLTGYNLIPGYGNFLLPEYDYYLLIHWLLD